MRAAYPDTDLLVFRHSHIPWDTAHAGLRLLNPGSPTDRRREPHSRSSPLASPRAGFTTSCCTACHHSSGRQHELVTPGDGDHRTVGVDTVDLHVGTSHHDVDVGRRWFSPGLTRSSGDRGKHPPKGGRETEAPRVAATGLAYRDMLFDENVGSHIVDGHPASRVDRLRSSAAGRQACSRR